MAAIVAGLAGAFPAAAAADHWTFDSRVFLNRAGTALPPVNAFEDSNSGHPAPLIDRDERSGGWQCPTAAGVRLSTRTVWYELNADRSGFFGAGASSAAFDPHVVVFVGSSSGQKDDSCGAEENADGNVLIREPVSVQAGDTILVAIGASSDCPVTEGGFVFASAFAAGSAGRLSLDRRLEGRLADGPAATAAQSRCNSASNPGSTTPLAPPTTPTGPGDPGRPGNVRRIAATAKLTAGSYLRLRGRRYLKLGIRSRRLVVSKVPSGATVEVTCTRRACRPFRSIGRGRPVSVSTLRNRRLRTGVRVVIRVTQAGRIGRYIRYTVKPNDYAKQERCLPVGSRAPRRSC